MHHAPRPAHFGISPEALEMIPGAGLVAGWELGNREEASADQLAQGTERPAQEAGLR